MPIPAYVDGDLRVQFLSPSLVRIERRGPEGFEDRPTFTAVGREWPGTPFRKEGDRLVTAGYTVVLHGRDLDGVRLVVGGKTVYTVGALPKNDWLPAPAKTGPVWPLADSPRMVPPKGGAIPANAAKGPTSGYDTGNDAPDLYLFVTNDPKRLRKDFLRLTGPVPLVPRYTLGFWDSLYHPYTDQQALGVIDEYRRRGFPLDLFVCDTDWRVGASKGYGVNERLFPDMTAFLGAAHAKGVRIMFNDHPEPQAPTALDPKETMYRWNGLTDLLRRGIDVWWYDRNWSTRLREPMPGIRPEVWGASVFQNVTAAFRPERRPLIMANVDGIDNGLRHASPNPAFHRYPIWWTGDTESTWRWLRYAVENGVDEGTIGMLPYVHEDTGGHRGDPNPELYTRFVQYGAFSPVIRVHGTTGKTRFPWAFGSEAERASSEAIHFRYRLIPTLYSATFQTHEDGTPLVRRLDLEWPRFPGAASSRQYLFGDDLLVSPVTASDAPDLRALPGPFHAEYFANEDLKGDPAVTREEKAIDFDWGQGSPAPGIPVDGFSARWTGRIGPMPRTTDYRFGTSSDDGARLWIDGKKIVDNWGPLDSQGKSATIRLEAGKSYDVRMEYQEIGGGANAHLLWGGAEEPRKGPMPWTFWCPPGAWIDPWTGGRVVGPKAVTMPAELRRVPMLVRDGAVLFLGEGRVKDSDEQLTKPITVEAWPAERATTRRLIEDDGLSVASKTTVRTATAVRTARGVKVTLSPAAGLPKARHFRFRIHLRPGERVKRIVVGGWAKENLFKVEEPGKAATGLDTLFDARGGSVVTIGMETMPAKWATSIEVVTK